MAKFNQPVKDPAALPAALAILMFIFPFDQVLKLSNLIDTENPLRLSQILGVLMVIYALWLSPERRRGSLMSWAGVLFLGYVGLNVFSLTYVPNQEFAARQLLVLLSWPVLYLAASLMTTRLAQVTPIIRLIVLSSYISLAFSILQPIVFWSTGITIGLLPDTTGDHLRGRAYGFYLEPNWFGVYQVLLFPILLWAYKYADQVGLSKPLQQLGLLMFFASFILSQNRGATLTLGFQLLLSFLIVKGWQNRETLSDAFVRRRMAGSSVLVISLFGVLAFFLLVVPSELQGGIFNRLVENIFSTEESASSGRLMAVQVMWISFLKSPFVGNGLASWGTLVQGWRIVEDSQVKANVAAPNEYLRFLSEDGLIGMALIAGIVWLYFKRLIEARRGASPVYYDLMGAFIISTAGFLATANFYGVRGMINALPLFGFYIAAAGLVTEAKRANPDPSPIDAHLELEARST